MLLLGYYQLFQINLFYYFYCNYTTDQQQSSSLPDPNLDITLSYPILIYIAISISYSNIFFIIIIFLYYYSLSLISHYQIITFFHSILNPLLLLFLKLTIFIIPIPQIHISKIHLNIAYIIIFIKNIYQLPLFIYKRQSQSYYFNSFIKVKNMNSLSYHHPFILQTQTQYTPPYMSEPLTQQDNLNNQPKQFSYFKSNFQQTKQIIDQFLIKVQFLQNQHMNLDKYRINSIIEKKIRSSKKEEIKNLIENMIRKMDINRRLKKNWNKEDIIVFIWIIQKYSGLNNKNPQNYKSDDWSEICKLIPGKNPQQCMFKWLNIHKSISKNLPWQQYQDQILKNLIQKFESKYKWNQISKLLFCQNNNQFKVFRPPKKCRQRWQCYLNPNIRKGIWQPQEDLLLLKKSFQIGKKWSRISKQLSGRTENAVKNRYQLLAEKSKKQKSKYSSQIENIRMYAREIQMNLMVNSNKKKSNSKLITAEELIQYQKQKSFTNLKFPSIQDIKQCRNNNKKQSILFMNDQISEQIIPFYLRNDKQDIYFESDDSRYLVQGSGNDDIMDVVYQQQ